MTGGMIGNVMAVSIVLDFGSNVTYRSEWLACPRGQSFRGD